MATVTITFGPKTKNYTVSGANLIRLQNWAIAAYPTIPNPTFGQVGHELEGPTIVNPDPVGSAMDALWSGLRANVISIEKATSVAAVAQPADLT